MSYYIKQDGSYYEGDRAHALDFEVPPRPSNFATWNGEQWVVDAKTQTNTAIDAQIVSLEQAAGGYNRGTREFMLACVPLFQQVMGIDVSVTPGMVKIKQLDDAIKALRVQRIS